MNIRMIKIDISAIIPVYHFLDDFEHWLISSHYSNGMVLY